MIVKLAFTTQADYENALLKRVKKVTGNPDAKLSPEHLESLYLKDTFAERQRLRTSRTGSERVTHRDRLEFVRRMNDKNSRRVLTSARRIKKQYAREIAEVADLEAARKLGTKGRANAEIKRLAIRASSKKKAIAGALAATGAGAVGIGLKMKHAADQAVHSRNKKLAIAASVVAGLAALDAGLSNR